MEKQLNASNILKKINHDFKDARTVRPYQSIEFSTPQAAVLCYLYSKIYTL